MPYTKDIIRKLRSEGTHISRCLERFLLHEYDGGVFPYGYTDETNAYFEIKGIVEAYAHIGRNEFPSSKYEIILEKYNDLKEDYLDLLRENRRLWDQNKKTYDEILASDYF